MVLGIKKNIMPKNKKKNSVFLKPPKKCDYSHLFLIIFKNVTIDYSHLFLIILKNVTIDYSHKYFSVFKNGSKISH